MIGDSVITSKVPSEWPGGWSNLANVRFCTLDPMLRLLEASRRVIIYNLNDNAKNIPR